MSMISNGIGPQFRVCLSFLGRRARGFVKHMPETTVKRDIRGGTILDKKRAVIYSVTFTRKEI